MKLNVLVLGFASTVVLSSCGGSKQSSTDWYSQIDPSLYESSSSTSSQSSSTGSVGSQVSDPKAPCTNISVSEDDAATADTECALSVGEIFIDTINPAWSDLSSVEQPKDSVNINELTDETQGQIATWSVVNTEDDAHQNVINVKFSNNDSYNAILHIKAKNQTNDLSAYTAGKLVFDVKLVNAGTYSPALNVVLGCDAPCATTGYQLKNLVSNEWATIEIATENLVNKDVDISKMDVGFQILPELNKQNGVEFQLDNIHWVESAVSSSSSSKESVSEESSSSSSSSAASEESSSSCSSSAASEESSISSSNSAASEESSSSASSEEIAATEL